MARLTRQELKKDEFADQLAAFQEFFLQNQQTIAKTSLIAVVLVAVIVGGFFLYSSREKSASIAFAEALTTFHAPISSTPQPGVSTVSFPSDTKKYEEALKQFTNVAQRYSWMDQGKYARYYAALCNRELGNGPDSEKELSDIAGSRDKELASLAKMALAGRYEQTGRNSDAEKLYRELESHPTSTVPKATAELALAQLYQRSKPEQAAALYQQIQKENPGSSAGDAAARMLQSQLR